MDVNLVRSKHPIKVGDVLIPRGEIGELVNLNDSSIVDEYFPNIKDNMYSKQALVKFPSFHKEFICSWKQIDFVEELRDE